MCKSFQSSSFKNSLKFQGIPLSFKEFPQVSRSFLKFQEVPSSFKKFPQVTRNSLKFQEVPSSFKKFPQVSRNFFKFQEVLSISMSVLYGTVALLCLYFYISKRYSLKKARLVFFFPFILYYRWNHIFSKKLLRLNKTGV